jgi:hypothetical protein
MVNTLFDQRPAERFAQILDDADECRLRRTRTSVDVQLMGYAGLGDQLGGVRLAGPDPDFRADLRAVLMATAERDGIGVTALRPQEPLFIEQRRSRTRVAIVAGVARGVLPGRRDPERKRIGR